MGNALVSVVIVNWNHGDFIAECLGALFAQQDVSFDVTVVDNGSTDGSREWVPSYYSDVRLCVFSENRGFSQAFNYGAARARGDFVLSLNPDVTVMPGFMREMLCAASRGENVGMVAPKLLRADDPARLDSTGLFVDRRRRPYDRGQGEIDRGQYDALTNVFGASGAAALYRRDMLEDLARNGTYFDEDFFAYYEDADLAWRARLRGWRCTYAPGAVATHERGWGDTLRKRGHAAKGSAGPRLALRNRYLMTMKNDAWRYTLLDLPLILGAELPRLAYAAVTVPGTLLGLLDLIRARPSALRKRRRIRARRTVDDATVRRWFVTPKEAAKRGS
jgi:GT2 family glycosyltransferase